MKSNVQWWQARGRVARIRIRSRTVGWERDRTHGIIEPSFDENPTQEYVMAAENTPELKMDPANLFREEIFTDRKIGTIRVMTPVKSDSSADASRKVIYVGETQLMTPVGA